MGAVGMTLVLLAGWGAFAYSASRRWRLLMTGAAQPRWDRIDERLRRTWRYAIAQLRMRRYPVAGLAHMLIFTGFIALLLRTLILWGRGFDGEFNLWLFGADQALGKVYGPVKDLFAVLVLLGACVFVYYRVVRRLPRMTLSREGLAILGIIIAMMLADIAYDAARIAREAPAKAAAVGEDPADSPEAHMPWTVEPAGSLIATALVGLPDGLLAFLTHAGFWTHSCLVLLFLNLLPYSKHFHVITGIPNVFFQSLDPPGRLPPIEDLEGKLEREETLGVRRIDQFTWKAMLDFYTCTECGRCSDHCPATSTGKKLSPKQFTIDLRNFLYQHDRGLISAKASSRDEAASIEGNSSKGGDGGRAESGGSEGAPAWQADLVGEGGVIDPAVVWACTSCRACEQECPVFITYVDKFVDLRRHLVQERGEFPAQLQAAFRGLESSANPWSFPAEDRAKWAEDLGIPTLAEKPDAAVLFWVGCAPSFDERAKKVTRATAKLMQRAGVDFAILGGEEQCTGDPARRAGNEFLFQMFAQNNVQTLSGYGCEKKTIVTTCPHCFNTLLNEYPDFGGKFNVVHHTSFLADLVRQRKLTPIQRLDRKVAYHDSCYLGRYNDEYDAPREVLRSIPGLTVLEPEATRDRGMCCGAGGAQMFKEEEHGTQRVSERRTEQLLATRPDAISSACPFCMRMLTDGLAAHGRDEVPQVDVAEMLLEAVG
ncbi:MAG: (Fe-S)-binding protein [Phycisphaerales bacterium]|nr:(Fe-S)-binding protein [Phycisphaerales bacterium]